MKVIFFIHPVTCVLLYSQFKKFNFRNSDFAKWVRDLINAPLFLLDITETSHEMVGLPEENWNYTIYIQAFTSYDGDGTNSTQSTNATTGEAGTYDQSSFKRMDKPLRVIGAGKVINNYCS